MRLERIHASGLRRSSAVALCLALSLGCGPLAEDEREARDDAGHADGGLADAAGGEPDAQGADAAAQGQDAGAELLPDAGSGGRLAYRSYAGGVIEVYRGGRDAIERVDAVEMGLCARQSLCDLLAITTVIVSPPRAGLDGIRELGELYAEAEGVAMYWGLDGAEVDPTLAIRYDSIMSWDLGLAHEVMHLHLFNLGEEADARVQQVREELKSEDYVDDPYANYHELFAYLGQWYLAGFGAIIEEQEEELYQVFVDYAGEARVSPGDVTEPQAAYTIELLLGWFRTGQPYW